MKMKHIELVEFECCLDLDYDAKSFYISEENL